MTVIHSCQMHLYCTSLVFHIWLNGPLSLLNLSALTGFLRLQTINWEKDEPCEKYLLDRNVSIDEAEVNSLISTLFAFVQKERQLNAIYSKMMEHDRWAKYFAT